MEGFLVYLLKVCLASSLMAIVFLLLFRKENLFQFNRFYLLAALVIPWLLPFITIKVTGVPESSSAEVITMFMGMTEFNEAAPATTINSMNPFHISLFVFYATGLLFFLLRLIISFLRIRIILLKCIRDKLCNQTVYITSQDLLPFSFFNKIVISNKTRSHPRLNFMIDHESVHVHQCHTMDILAAEVFKILQWFNPFAWILERSLKTNLEYIADAEATKTIKRIRDYQVTLFSLASGKVNLQLINNFNYSQLKKRITMMKNNKQPKKLKIKHMLVLPLAGMLLFTFCSKEAFYDVNTSDILVSGTVTDSRTHEPVSGVSVIVRGNDNGAVTGDDGTYTVALSKPDDVLTFMYNNEVINVLTDGRNKIDIELNNENIIKGRSTIMNGVNPIYFIDGIRADIETINLLDPDDIHSIQVLKNDQVVDFAGSEEAKERGVIIITTKKAAQENAIVQDDKSIKESNGKSGQLDEVTVIGYWESDISDDMSMKKSDGKSIQWDDIVVRGYMRSETGENTPEQLKKGSMAQASDEGPVIMLNGELFEGSIDELDPSTIESVAVFSDDQAFERAGTEEARQKGLMVITTKETK